MPSNRSPGRGRHGAALAQGRHLTAWQGRPAVAYLLAVVAACLVLVVAGGGTARAAEGAPLGEPLGGAAGTPSAEAIRLGERLVTDTYRQLPEFVGNRLTCANCHLGAGTVENASPWVGILGAFPEYRARSGKLISLEERINDCMQRSMNGAPLPHESPAMLGFLAYIRWLSEGVPTGSKPRGFGPIDATLQPSALRGRVVYGRACASCHGPDGQGRSAADGTVLVPALWGGSSFNIGAGMARTYTAAAFIRHNMPLGSAGSLSDQEAIDVAQFVTHQPRPDFPARSADWPRGDAPVDARLEKIAP